MEDINERFVEPDVAIVVGANDVVNPAEDSSGVENDLYVDPKTAMRFKDAR
jgi:NAD(P) transhydrogenase subunit beta